MVRRITRYHEISCSSFYLLQSSAVVQQCSDLSDIVPLSEPSALFLKPIARVTVDVRLPKSLSTNSVRPGHEGKAISNWEVMEKVKSLARPHVFSVMKVVSSSLEVLLK